MTVYPNEYVCSTWAEIDAANELYVAVLGRRREVDAAVREGLKRAADGGLASWARESDYAVRAYIAPHVRQAWREQHV